MTVETFAWQELWQPAHDDKRPDAAVLVRACAVRRTKSRKGRKGAQLAEMGPIRSLDKLEIHLKLLEFIEIRPMTRAVRE